MFKNVSLPDKHSKLVYYLLLLVNQGETKFTDRKILELIKTTGLTTLTPSETSQPEIFIISVGSKSVQAIREVQIISTLRFHFTPVRMAMTKKANEDKCWQGWGEGESWILLFTMETKRIKIELSSDPATPCLGLCAANPILLHRIFHILIQWCFSHNSLGRRNEPRSPSTR